MSIRQIIANMKIELEKEKKLFQFLNKRKEFLPPGSLITNCYKADIYYYQQIYDHGRRNCYYLDPEIDEHAATIKELIEKKTLIHAIPIIRDNIMIMDKFLATAKVYHPANYKYGRILSKEYYIEGDVCIRDWKKKEESQNPFRRQDLIHETKRGMKVRSKSEVLISDTLYDFSVPAKCEVAFRTLSGKIVYPDFEILHPKTNELIWWEHLGRADDGGYMEDNLKKLEQYGKTGLIPGKNLILTSETAAAPLTRGTVLRKMKEYDII